MSVAAFTTAQRTIKVLDLRREIEPLPLLPDVLPNLQELHASSEQVKQLVPGRPVEAIYITCPRYNDQDGLGSSRAVRCHGSNVIRRHCNTRRTYGGENGNDASCSGNSGAVHTR